MIETLTRVLAVLFLLQAGGLALGYAKGDHARTRELLSAWILLVAWPIIVPAVLATDFLADRGWFAHLGVFDGDDTDSWFPGHGPIDGWSLRPVKHTCGLIHLGEWTRTNRESTWVAIGRPGARRGLTIGCQREIRWAAFA